MAVCCAAIFTFSNTVFGLRLNLTQALFHDTRDREEIGTSATRMSQPAWASRFGNATTGARSLQASWLGLSHRTPRRRPPNPGHQGREPERRSRRQNRRGARFWSNSALKAKKRSGDTSLKSQTHTLRFAPLSSQRVVREMSSNGETTYIK